MDGLYDAHGVRFRYPDDWELSEQTADGELTITVSSRETSFWTLSLLFERPEPEDVLKTAVDVFREEYDNIDVYCSQERLCQRQAFARDVEFVCLELINSAFLRAFSTERFTVLVFYQGTDHELEQTRPMLEQISGTLQCDEEGQQE